MLLNEGRDSFLEEVVNFNDARDIVIPVPIDITTTYLKGTKFGPRSVIEASRSLENYDSEVGYELKDKIFTLNELELSGDIRNAVEIINLSTSDIISSGKIPILIGGEHTATYGASLAFGEDVEFVIFDAHTDFKPDFLKLEINHASNSRLVNLRNNVSIVGVRSFNLEEKAEIEKRKLLVIPSDKISDSKNIESLVNLLRGKKVYISIDMDVFDPSIAPGVGTPQPNGILYKDFLRYASNIIHNSALVGMDVMETRPLNDNNITEILAAKAIMDLVSLNELKNQH
ncbi:MAG: agmatinase [Candidatus Parvarchaeum acidiphilum ARMAN-4]|uniref:Agmatinase n=1 Tax=Candidatus Parvarchaeum acidiphilum ARMAN-4 TaxID=662760 RepID=D2EFA5_PARA4|nr:MAG: agmatinase [Candidatus Parvarchaeum acidiphilum ARMAN-4]